MTKTNYKNDFIMKKIRITLVKSVIDRPETAKRTVAALGLKKMNASVEVEATPQILGMVRRAGHLLKVEEVPSVETAVNEVAA
jgi:large subunit ribosomal protein L30